MARGALEEVADHAAEIEELRQAILRKDSVVANITHELRNPITVITGFADTLRRHWHSIDEGDRIELIERIHAMGERMGATVENLLKLARMEAGESPARPGQVHLSHLLFTRLFELGDRARVITVSCPADAAITADESHVWEILQNFIENAFKYGAPPVEISARSVDDSVEIRVRDHGAGVPDDFVPHLFDRFSRSKDVADDTDGSGLGLSITKALAQANGGDVRYEAVDDGACFVISLPAATV